MANAHETLTGLFSATADAIRSKTGGTGAIVADKFPDAIAAIDTQENLDAELTAQDDLIARINTALEGKSAGGGSGVSIETCTVVLNYNGITRFLCSTFDGTAVDTYDSGDLYELTGEDSIPNVICNSLACISMLYPDDMNITVNGMSVDATNNTVVTIEPSETDGNCYISCEWGDW